MNNSYKISKKEIESIFQNDCKILNKGRSFKNEKS